MKRNLIAVLAIILIASGIFWAYKHRGKETAPLSTLSTNDTSTKDAAWAVFEKYINAIKNHDLASIKSISYQISPTCSDITKTKDCTALMDSAYYFGWRFKESDLTHMTYDDKQIILSGDYFTTLTGDSPSATRPIVYFVREGDTIKFLSFNPFQGAFILKGTQATSTIETRLGELTKDTDNDGAPDNTELCKGADYTLTCKKTDPNVKDTNGNGWWDSTEALFYKN